MPLVEAEPTGRDSRTGRGEWCPDRRRVAVEQFQGLGASERRACQVVGRHSSNHRRPKALPGAIERLGAQRDAVARLAWNTAPRGGSVVSVGPVLCCTPVSGEFLGLELFGWNEVVVVLAEDGDFVVHFFEFE